MSNKQALIANNQGYIYKNITFDGQDLPGLVPLSAINNVAEFIQVGQQQSKVVNFAAVDYLFYVANVEAAPAETITIDKWLGHISQPLARQNQVTSEIFFVSNFITTPETVTVDKWHPLLQQPITKRFFDFNTINQLIENIEFIPPIVITPPRGGDDAPKPYRIAIQYPERFIENTEKKYQKVIKRITKKKNINQNRTVLQNKFEQERLSFSFLQAKMKDLAEELFVLKQALEQAESDRKSKEIEIILENIMIAKFRLRQLRDEEEVLILLAMI